MMDFMLDANFLTELDVDVNNREFVDSWKLVLDAHDENLERSVKLDDAYIGIRYAYSLYSLKNI